MSGNGISILLMATVCTSGALIAAQGPIYSHMATSLGSALHAGMIAFASGALAFFVLSLASGQAFPALSDVQQIPLWVWLGGTIGVFVVLVSIFAVPKLGVATFAVTLIAGQLLASFFYDKFGAFDLEVRHFTPTNIAGLFLVLIGAVLVSHR